MSNPFERDSLSADSCEHIFPRDRTYLSATPPPPPAPAKKRNIATAIKKMKIDDTSNGRKVAKKKPAMKDEAKGGELYTSKQPVKAKTKKKAANNDDGNERPKKKSRAGQSGAGWDAEEEAPYWNDILNRFKPDWSYILSMVSSCLSRKETNRFCYPTTLECRLKKRDLQKLAAGVPEKATSLEEINHD